MPGVSVSHLFRQFMREEWRMHSRMFGGARFAAFPAFVTLVVAGAYYFFRLAGTDPGTFLLGVHALAFAFGLHVGTIGLVGRDAMENLLGEMTLLLYVSRTLPVSQRRLLAVFLVKDVVYYAGLFITPLIAGVALVVAVTGPLALLLQLPLAWATTLGTFVLGIAVSLTLVSLATRSRLLSLGFAVGVGLTAWYAPDVVLAATPYAVFVRPALYRAVLPLAAIVGFTAVGFVTFSFDRRSPARTAPARLAALSERIPGDTDGLVAKSLLDVHRSSGGVVKLFFSLGLIFAVVGVLLDTLARIFPLRPVPGVAFGALLALGAFTTYNWITQADDERVYGALPIPLAAVFRAKLVTFLLTVIPVGLAYLGLAGLWFGFDGFATGVVVFLGAALYLFGVTSYLTGLSPNELLFDTVVFVQFWVAMSLLLVPLMVYAFVASALPPVATAGILGLSGVAGVVGIALYRRAGPRWEQKQA